MAVSGTLAGAGAATWPTGHTEASWLQGLDYRVSRGELAIRGLDIAPKDEEALPDTSLKLTSISLEGLQLGGI